MTEAEFFAHLHKLCPAGIWSKAVALVRTHSVLPDSMSSQEKILRVQDPPRPMGRKVTLWISDEDWFCDCEAKTPVCVHVAAAVIFLNQQGSPSTEMKKIDPTGIKLLRLRYVFRSIEGSPSVLSHQSEARSPIPSPEKSHLRLERQLIGPDQSITPLKGSLVSLLGGISSGRIPSLPISATQEDLKIDALLNNHPDGLIPSSVMLALLKILAGSNHVLLNEQPIEVSARSLTHQLILTDEGAGYRLRLILNYSSAHPGSLPAQPLEIQAVYRNGAAWCENTLLPFEPLQLPFAEVKPLLGQGLYFAPGETQALVVQWLPSFEKKIPLHVLSQKLPCAQMGQPRIILELTTEPKLSTEKTQGSALSEDGPQHLFVLPRLTYESPNSHPKKIPSGQTFTLPNPTAERALQKKLQSELHLSLGQRACFSGLDAVHWVSQLGDWETEGEALKAFQLYPELSAQMKLDERDFSLSFETLESLEPSGPSSCAPFRKTADFKQVFQAWRENQSLVPLLGGGWAPLPRNWLNQYGERILSILDSIHSRQLNDPKRQLPKAWLPELLDLCDEQQSPYPESLKQFKRRLTQIDTIPIAPLPQDLSANLRAYQQIGVNWLHWLKESQMGALLADDMGLGKTLQAICTIDRRCLIVAPTSVLPNWSEQLACFRPTLRVCLYSGKSRKIDHQADVILTSYAILRLDHEVLTQEPWAMILLDEAQSIKNPESQTAQAAHRLKAPFRLALSGTPVENHLTDLWSLFEFLNPGLLGSLSDFKENRTPLHQLQRKIKPFVLRRLKKEVAPELPPKTETTLYCELEPKERDLYDSFIASTRSEVLDQLEHQGSVLLALELLLRLRQACCHPDLAQKTRISELKTPSTKTHQAFQPSSKIRLLMEKLNESIENQHRSLVFSQWTAHLDLIEEALKQAHIRFLRLDGSTRNRGEVVSQFQTDPTIPVLLISLKAGGTGLNLTAADHVYLMDPWWNPAVENQAADRVHRIGQENPVLIHHLVAQNTVEEKIMALQKEKQKLAQAVLAGSESGPLELTKDDLLSLLS
ncbi:MAG: DEAD/DEAH box helicase [Bdellovibrionia bacterium]